MTRSDDTLTRPSTIIWDQPSQREALPRPFRLQLQIHLDLSSQLSHALFSAIQSAYSTSLPPTPIAKPEWLPEPLRRLPVWLSSTSAPPTPTPEMIIPSLVAVHDSLGELMFRARTHQANVRKLAALEEEVQLLQTARKHRILQLRDANVELKAALRVGKEQRESIDSAERHPLNYAHVLAYAADLARNTSAPPGWSGGNLLRDSVQAALAKQENEKPNVEVTDPAQPPTAAGEQGADEAESSKGVPQTPATNTNADQVDETDDGPSAAAAPGRTPFLNPEQDGPSASSAPHSFPFPSDADMRRGLMGLAMLDEEGGGMKGILPSWRSFTHHRRAEEEAMIQQQDTRQDHQQQQQLNAAMALPQGAAPMRVDKVEEEEEGFGLDL